MPLDVIARKLDRGYPSAKPGHRCARESAVLGCPASGLVSGHFGLQRERVAKPVTGERARAVDLAEHGGGRKLPNPSAYTTLAGRGSLAHYLLARPAGAIGRHMLLVAALLPLPRVRVGPRGGLAQLSAADEYAVRRCDMADPADAAAYRAVSQSRDALARPGVVQDAPAVFFLCAVESLRGRGTLFLILG